MTFADLTALLPFLVLAFTSVVLMLVIAFRRNHALTVGLALAGLGVAFASVFGAWSAAPRRVTPLLVIDGYALFYVSLFLAATFGLIVLANDYLKRHEGYHKEFYVLLLLAALGATVLAASNHFASFFLGLELLSVSLYGLIAYLRGHEHSFEAGIKYLILAAASAAFLLFGMAMVYADQGTMAFDQISWSAGPLGTLLLGGMAMMIVGLGFKLAVVPFHLWTPDVYQGAPAPVTAFVATVSKGGVFALLLRLFAGVDLGAHASLFVPFSLIAVASMLAGNLLALRQNNVKRILAYSSIAHLGYLLVAFLAGGRLAVTAVTFYLMAYFVTTLSAFGVVTVLSCADRDADALHDYRGLFWRRPWLAAVLAVSLFSLAGIPLTGGFVAKFYVLTAGVRSTLWWLVLVLVISSAIGLYYYLRVIVVMYQKVPQPEEQVAATPPLPLAAALVLATLIALLLWLGIYPASWLDVIRATLGPLL
ncbi:MAG: NADH-quinone oxidoreductase subunit N [Anaerolineae bacterium]|jgi:NADH-quinone oxidoreductase subunit N